MAYFTRTGSSTFLPSSHVSGAWNPEDQHIAPAMGLLAHVVELDRDTRRRDRPVLARLCYDIFGTMPVDTVETGVRVVRSGRTVELVEAVLRQGGRTALSLRAWLMQEASTTEVAGTLLPPIAPPAEMAPWEPSSLWPGGFLASLEVRRAPSGPGRARYWVCTAHELVEGEPASATARAAGLLDLANGMAVRVSPEEAAFPNVDLTAHLLAEPDEGWLGFDTSVSFGVDGLGVTNSVIHGALGPIGTVAQILTIRPRASGSSAR